ncbi:hypothetical protein CYY_005454 [Polysphondylium violaceum]|uniref:Uncharacterized protein n=1 Tax=Polysphondylium violaceum TaxID=133409 RepID=A0A8J4PTP6_9MYCE|nr:hypothetical protein CYY_005454 [Polysphondylium violaceum]
MESSSNNNNKNNINENNNINQNNNNNLSNNNTSSLINNGAPLIKGIKIRNYMTKDKDIFSKICRLPHDINLNTLKAYSICYDYSIRRSMAQNGYIYVAEDKDGTNVMGGICVLEKKLRLGGKEKIFFYPFDAIVEPKFRSYRILQRLTDYATNLYMEHSDYDPIIYTSTSVVNTRMDKFYNNTAMVKIIDQVQHAWKVDIKLQPSQFCYDSRFKIWKERDDEIVKKKLNQYFKDYEMCPVEFDDLLLNKFWKYTYFAQWTQGDKVYEASISIWDQNKVCTLIDLEKKENTKLKFFQIFGCYTSGNPENVKIDIFQELLKHVHNDCYHNGIDFLFIGLSKTDPIDKYFPLLSGIKSLNFALHFCVGNTETKEEALALSNNPFFQDPRDYGIVLLHQSSPSDEGNENQSSLIYNPISSKL